MENGHDGSCCGGEGQKTCNCPHHKMIPLGIVLIGLVFLLGALGVLAMSTVNITWPIIVILIGLQKMMRGMCKCCSRP